MVSRVPKLNPPFCFKSSGEIGMEALSLPMTTEEFVINGGISSSFFSRCAPLPSSAAFLKDPFLLLVFSCWTATAIARLVFLGDVGWSLVAGSGLGGPLSAWIWLSSALALKKESFESPPDGLLLCPPGAASSPDVPLATDWRSSLASLIFVASSMLWRIVVEVIHPLKPSSNHLWVAITAGSLR